MSAGVEETLLTGRCYTKARRHPGVVGRWPGGGGKLPGGPYTLPQLSMMLPAMAVCFGLLYVTRGLWGDFGVGNYVVLLVVPAAVGFAASRVRVDGRPPLSVALSIAGLVFRPRAGRQSGRAVAAVPGGRVRPLVGQCTYHVCEEETDDVPEFSARTAPAAAAPLPSAAGGGGRVASGAGALLARAGRAGVA